MRNIYTAQFEIIPVDHDLEGIAESVSHSVTDWIKNWYESRQGISVAIPEVCHLEPQEGHTVDITLAKSARASVRGIQWSYPHGDNLHWTVVIEIARFDTALEFSLRLSIESTQFYIAPLTFEFGRPRIVLNILRAFECYCGGARLSSAAQQKNAAEIPLLVSERLRSPSRRLPVVIVSPESLSGTTIISADHLAESLAGIAEVYNLSDKWAAFALTNCIGRQHLACYNGAIRIYWPLGIKTFDAYCPVYLPNTIREKGANFIEKTLLREFSSISSFRFISGPISSDANALLAEEKRMDQVHLRKAAEDRGDYEALAESYKQEADQLRSENNQQKLQLAQSNSEMSDLRGQVATYQANFQAISSTTQSTSLSADVQEPDHEERSVAEIVAYAEKAYVTTLLFTKNSHKSALNSPFRHPERVAEALEAMTVVCEAWKTSRKNRQSSGSFEEMFEALGFAYKARESQTTVGKWPEEYEMLYKGQKVSIQPHLALGNGKPDVCLRVQFHIDEAQEIFVIDHVGRHKTNTST